METMQLVIYRANNLRDYCGKTNGERAIAACIYIHIYMYTYIYTRIRFSGNIGYYVNSRC